MKMKIQKMTIQKRKKLNINTINSESLETIIVRTLCLLLNIVTLTVPETKERVDAICRVCEFILTEKTKKIIVQPKFKNVRIKLADKINRFRQVPLAYKYPYFITLLDEVEYFTNTLSITEKTRRSPRISQKYKIIIQNPNCCCICKSTSCLLPRYNELQNNLNKIEM